MRRALSVLVGLITAATVLVAAPAHAAVAESTFQIGIVADEGPAPTSRSLLSFDAVLESAGTPIGGVPVTLTARPYGASSFVAIGHGTTADDGSVQIDARLAQTSRIQWRFAGNAEYAASASFAYLRTIGRTVVAHAADRTLSGRQRVVVTGAATPARPGLRVSLWRGDVPAFAPDLHYTRIAVGTIRADGTFRLTARFAHPGAKRLYVKVNAGSGNDVGYSRYLRIRVH